MALLCEAYGSNVWRVRELINNCKKATDTRPEALRQMHYPGAGVGGHCIPKDSWLLIHKVREEVKPQLIPTARHINDFMPMHMYELFEQAVKETDRKVENMNVLILGYAYDANSDDDRNTPTRVLMGKLDENSVKYDVHDPYIDDYKGNLEEILKGKDAIILVTGHDEYKKLKYDDMLKLMGKKQLL